MFGSKGDCNSTRLLKIEKHKPYTQLKLGLCIIVRLVIVSIELEET